MSSRLKIKILKLILLGIIVLFWLLILFFLMNVESEKKLRRFWKVESIYINKINKIDEYERRGLSFFNNGEALLPKHQGYIGSIPVVYSQWKYKRKNLYNGIIEIKDLEQNIFDGKYEIEFLNHQEPIRIKLISKKIVLFLKAGEAFSSGNTTIRN